MLLEILIESLLLYVLVVWAVVQFIKKKVVKPYFEIPGWSFFLLSIALGILLSYGWQLSILPTPIVAEFIHLSRILTGFVIGAAASGLFSGLDKLFPELNL